MSDPIAAKLVDVVIPVYNEEHTITRAVTQLTAYLQSAPFRWRIVIADNASRDATLTVAQGLAAANPHVKVVHLDQKGRGRALRQVWLDSDADVVSYMDVDLSTDLRAFYPLVMPLLVGHSDLAIGTRLHRDSNVVRGLKREAISRTYNLMLKLGLQASFSDAQCGFKAMRTDIGRQLLPFVEDNEWFFDTELLVLAKAAGCRVHEVPVDWIDDPDTRVNIVDTAIKDIKGMIRMQRRLASGKIPFQDMQLTQRPESTGGRIIRFLGVGVASTILYTALFFVFGLVLHSIQLANFIALFISAIVNTIWNRSFTFRVQQEQRRHADLVVGIVVFFAGWLATAGALKLAEHLGHDVLILQTIFVTLANVVVTLLKFVIMHFWFKPKQS